MKHDTSSCRYLGCRRPVGEDGGEVHLCDVHVRKMVRATEKFYNASMALMQELYLGKIKPSFFREQTPTMAPFHGRCDRMVADALPFWEKDCEWWTRQEAAEQRKTKKAA